MNMMNELTVRALLDYLEEDGPDISWPEEEFDAAAYSRWAASELVNAILDHPAEPAEDTIFEFVLKMQACVVMAREKPTGIPFSIAADFAYDCLETLF